MKSLGIGVSMMIVRYRATSRAYADTKDYITSRIASVYQHARVMEYRKSQDNPAVKKLYDTFLNRPMGLTSERLLHTKYVDRSGALKKVG